DAFAKKTKLAVQTGHSSMINITSFSPNGECIVTESEDKTAKFWDVNTRIEKIYLPTYHSIRCYLCEGKVRVKKQKNIVKRKINPTVMSVVYKWQGKGYKRWAETLSSKVSDIISEMIETFSKNDIDLYVPLMIDYEYWFKNTADVSIKYQLDYIYRIIILYYKGTIHPFVSFDPARELAFRKGMNDPDGNPEIYGSMELVKDAIENKGFIGVKLYNVMGYRPFNNNVVDKKHRKIAFHKKDYVFNGEKYDEGLAELYDYCIEKEVPITTHCCMDGSESYKDTSFDFGQAVFWRDVLDQERFKNLHLNLAHFGRNKKQGHEGDRSWVQELCKMISQYDNLYTDVSHHEVLNEKNRTKFKSAYDELCSEYPKIEQKLLFGIAWHVIKRVDHFPEFKERYLEVLTHDNLFSDAEIEDFLRGNALCFLGLTPN
ncbi:MAG: amidohydrolase family protein, partial [Candidatus Hodarchaeota archaeon]